MTLIAGKQYEKSGLVELQPRDLSVQQLKEKRGDAAFQSSVKDLPAKIKELLKL